MLADPRCAERARSLSTQTIWWRARYCGLDNLLGSPHIERSELAATASSAVIGDLTRPQNMSAALEGVDAVVHSAGLAHAMSGVPENDGPNRAGDLGMFLLRCRRLTLRFGRTHGGEQSYSLRNVICNGNRISGSCDFWLLASEGGPRANGDKAQTQVSIQRGRAPQDRARVFAQTEAQLS